MSHDPRTRRCIVWTDHADAPQPLVSSLRQKSLDIVTAPTGPDVMAELAKQKTHLCIITGARHANAVARLLAAVQRYFPGVVCAQYKQNENDAPTLVPMSTAQPATSDSGPGESRVASRKPGVNAARDARKSTERLERDDAPPPRRPVEAGPPSSLLTPQELQVLIGEPIET